MVADIARANGVDLTKSLKPILHLICGKIAAGKSTLAAQLAEADNAVLVSEDAWLADLFKDQISDGQDYLQATARLRRAMSPHVVALLKVGTSVVLDFQANTLESRRWMRGIIDQTGVDHRLHILNPTDDICLARLRARNAKAVHPFKVSEEQFLAFSKHFELPSKDEDFHLVTYDAL